MIFHQLFERESSTYTYLLADAKTGEAILIDPVFEMLERDLKLILELDLKLVAVFETHIHADHMTAASEIRKRTQAKTFIGKASKVKCADELLDDGQLITFGNLTIKALATPGHTESCMSYYVADRVFTGDALLIRGTGRTDFQQGSSHKLYESITTKLFKLPPETIVYPAHDYRGYDASTIGDEMRYNPRIKIGTTEEQFVKTMSELKLSRPPKLDEVLAANLACGQRQETLAR